MMDAMSKRRTYGTGSVYLPAGKKTWMIQFFRNGKRYRESSDSETKEGAKNALKRRLGEIAAGRFYGLAPERITVSELCGLVAEDYRLSQKRSVSHVVWRSDRHIRPALGPMKAAEFGSVHLKAYVAQRQREGASAGTINRELAVIRRGYHLALQADPPLVSRIPFLPRLLEENVREGFIEQEQYRALLAALPQHLRCLFVVAYHVGNRKGELLNLRRSQVSLTAREIRLTARETKGKLARTLPIYGDMAAFLEMAFAEADQTFPQCCWAFQRHGKRIDAHLTGWRQACEQAGLPGLLFHDLRRSAVRNLERAGVPRKVAMQITGHRTEAVYRRYDIVAPADLRLAAAKLEAYMEASQTATQKATPRAKPQ